MPTSTALALFVIVAAILQPVHGAPPTKGFSKAIIFGSRTNREPVSDELLRAVGAQRLIDYESYTLVVLPSDDAAEISSLLQSLEWEIEVHDDWDRVHMPSYTVDARAPVQPPSGTLANYSGGKGLHVVQFIGPVKPEWRASLDEHHFKICGYIPNNSFLVFGATAALEQLRALPFVQYADIYHSAFRAQPRSFDVSATKSQEYTIQFAHVPENVNEVAELLARNDGAVSQIILEGLSLVNWQVSISPANARALLSSPFVVAVEERSRGGLSGEREARAMGEEITAYLTWLESTGMADTHNYYVAIADTGLADGAGLLNHQDFTTPYPVTGNPSFNRPILWRSYVHGEGAFDNDGHGTAVAGMAVGYPPNTSAAKDPTYYYGLGVAPKTGLIVQKAAYADPSGQVVWVSDDPRTWIQDAKTLGATIQNQSRNEYFVVTPGAYSTIDQTYDQRIYEENLPITVSAGNNGGYTLSPAVAKNVITVGATESSPERSGVNACAYFPYHNASATNVASTSRRGTLDGRIKPEVLAPGAVISTALWDASNITNRWCQELPGTTPGSNPRSNLTDDHLYETGTSFAVPQAAAAAVLLNKKGGFGPTSRMSAALTKAALIGNTISLWRNAADPTFGNWDWGTGSAVRPRTHPDSGQGFGRLNLYKALENSAYATQQEFHEERSSSQYWYWNWAFTAPGQTRSTSFYVCGFHAYEPTVIVLVWTDPAGFVNPQNPSAPALTHNLDLKVQIDSCTASGGIRYRGNRFNYAEPYGSQTDYSTDYCGFGFVGDGVNNVEVVVIPPEDAGTYITVHVDSISIPYGQQKFALYVLNGASVCPY